VIAFEGVAARRTPLALANVSFAWGPGVHAVVGGSADGGLLLLALITGAERPRSGHVRVLDGGPTDPAVRARVAFVPIRPALPEAMRVREALSIAAAIRGEPPRDAAERLHALGVEALASRMVETLSPEEARAVALTEAATSSRVRILLVEEPFVSLDPRAATCLPEVLRARARDGCAVVLATASVRDAGELADDHVLMRDGAVAGRVASLDELARFSPQGVRLRILASDGRALAAALAREPGVEAVARMGETVVARGRDAVELAQAVERAIAACGVEVTEMRIKAPSLDEVRAAVAAAASAEPPPDSREGPPAGPSTRQEPRS
jgi:ABC-2 type transport system ATP-binding protein